MQKTAKFDSYGRVVRKILSDREPVSVFCCFDQSINCNEACAALSVAENQEGTEKFLTCNRIMNTQNILAKYES